MKKNILLTLLFLLPLLGISAEIEIDETKSDIYFANGVLTDDGNATKNLKLISDLIFIEQYIDDMDKMEKELNFKKAYNQTVGFVGDFYESYKQLADESDGWAALEDFINTAMMFIPGQGGKLFGAVVTFWDDAEEQAHDADLSLQIAKYRASVRSGHSVIVVAHSQGNLFTNEAYRQFTQDEELDGTPYRRNAWLSHYFKRISIASPSSINEGGDIHVSFHNDPITQLSSFSQMTNPNKAYLKNALGDIIEEDALSADFHAFTYYMGEKSAQGTGQVGSGYHAKVSTDIAKVIIMDFIKNAIVAHRTAQSQWAVDKEIEKGTKEFKVTLTHRYNDAQLISQMKDVKVYPFAPNKKLYQVKDTAGTSYYIQASFGGERILDADKDSAIWKAKENQFYKLEGTDPVEYIEIKERFIRDHEREMVLDTETNLLWQDDYESASLLMSWYQAVDYCGDLVLGAYDDWKLPDLKQLESIVDKSNTPTIYNAFVNLANDEYKYYWSATEVNQYYAWDIPFGYGYASPWGEKDSSNIYVRCVRIQSILN